MSTVDKSKASAGEIGPSFLSMFYKTRPEVGFRMPRPDTCPMWGHDQAARPIDEFRQRVNLTPEYAV